MALGGLWTRVTGLMFGIGIGRTAGAATEPIFELVRQEAWQENANRVLSLTQVANLVAMGITDFDSAAEQAAREGFDTNRLRAMVEYYLNPPQYGYAYDALRRGEISEAQFRHVLTKQGIERQYHDALVELRHVLPSVTDMVRFAVREVYNPPLRKALGIDAEYPPAFTEQAALHGLSEEHAREYWAAHWRLPSARQGYQMLWRGEIEPDDLDNLLKALDYPPMWRDRLANIAHIVPGRIDLKRMFKLGIKTRAEVYEGYVKIGYAPADAESMTQIAEAEVGAGTTRETWASKARNRLYTVAHDEYLDWSIDADIARSTLAQIDIPDGEITLILAAWDAEQSIARLELTPAQVKKAYYKGLYDLPTALTELQQRGMTLEDADTFLQEQ